MASTDLPLALILSLCLRHAPRAFRSALLLMLNYSWVYAVYVVLPRDWLTAHITPIHKGHGAPPRHLAKSYRPISLTSTPVKLLERMLLARLVPFLENRKFFSRFQSGFRAGHSTLDQLSASLTASKAHSHHNAMFPLPSSILWPLLTLFGTLLSSINCSSLTSVFERGIGSVPFFPTASFTWSC